MLDFPECTTLNTLFKSHPSSDLQSTLPYSTAVAFASIQTGQDPARHGVQYFFNNGSPFTKVAPTPCNGDSIQVETLYEKIHSNGKKCFIMGVPLSYPPKIQGDMVFDWTAGIKDSERLFQPASLLDTYPYLADYKAFPDKAVTISEWAKGIYDITKTMTRLVTDVVRSHKYDFSFFYIQAPDALSHRLLPSLMNNDQDGSIKMAKQSFAEIDRMIPQLVQELRSDELLIIMSDHGHIVYDHTFNINNWLAENGFLSYTTTNVSAKENATALLLHRKHDTSMNVVADKKPIRVPKWLGNLGRDYPTLKPLATKLRNFVEDKTGRAVTDYMYVDTDKSLAASVDHGAIYINPNLPHEKRDSVIQEIVNKLPATTGDIEAYDTAKIYDGPFLQSLPEIYLSSSKFMFAKSGASTIENKKRSNHRRDGILLLIGDVFEKSPQNPTLLDLAPTILHLMGIPVSEDMQGRVLSETLRTDSEPALRQILYTQSSDQGKSLQNAVEQKTFTQEEEEELSQRLKSLGYI
jgi:predicted AlkP superfamily phosphohydrolase/phosphomutase